jgi:Tol biopolymer transport system component
MNADGSAQTPLTDQTGDDKTSPSWSPDGSKIVYMYSYSVRASDIWTVNADGTGEFNVTGGANPGGGGDNTSPVWSPDGLRIAFVFGFGSGTPEVRVIAVNGSGLRTRVDGRLSSYAPDW